jgi:DNA-directed RNA polymerase II subunit RPB1
MAAYESIVHQTGAVAQAADPLSGGTSSSPKAIEQKSPWILRFELDRQRMFDKNITMDDIAFILKNRFASELETQYSDYNSTRLVFRIRLNTNSNPIDDLTVLKQLQHKVLSQTAIRGIPGLRSVNYQKISDIVELKDGKYTPVDQYVLVSDGSNFADVMTHPDVDASRVISSNVHDMFENLGIEATRATLFKEITTLFAENGSSVNYRHVCTLIDKMCHKGRTMSIDRYGINKNDIGPLAKMSFEQTEDIALRAAIFGERDPILGVSAKVMLGAPIRAGTSFSELIFDELSAIKLAASTPEQKRRGPMGPDVYNEGELDDALYGDVDRSVCATTMNELQMNVTIPAARLQTVEEEIADVDISIVE